MAPWLTLLALVVVLAACIARAFFVGRAGPRATLAAAESSLEAARAQLEDDRRRLVMTVSHELRTPLTVVQGIVNTLATHWTALSEGQRLDLIDTITTNVSSLDASILHFIDVAKLERGETVLRPTDVDLAPLVDGVLTKLAPIIVGHTVRTQLDITTAWADRDALARILELLLSNAVRFSPIATTIYVRARPADDDGIDLAVVDRGAGISPQHLAHVFEPFWRADTGESGVSRGAGLGLTIVKELAELHGGTVRVLSSRGRGSAFHVRLPGRYSMVPTMPAAHSVG
jgi:signal transduction histidine kinase